ncbi:MAG: DUF4136 domain-containing protein [Bacteroidaceae bacterium]|nr:DUF4136 domain-containing protein [Bacteroidaceae bacterium]
MKKFSIPALLAVCALSVASCQKDPDVDKLDNSYLVYTNYDSGTDFKYFNSFYVIDSILIIDNSEKPAYWNNGNSAKIVDAFTAKLALAGYEEAYDETEADIVLQLSYVNTTYYFNVYNPGPWWNSYPGYWNWGGWGWYYPYSFSYSYSTGSIIGELVDTNAPTPLNDKLTVVWNTYICGLLNGNNLSLSRTMEAIDQAFEQSPYLKRGNTEE